MPGFNNSFFSSPRATRSRDLWSYLQLQADKWLRYLLEDTEALRPRLKKGYRRIEWFSGSENYWVDLDDSNPRVVDQLEYQLKNPSTSLSMTSSPNFWANVTVQKNRQVLRYTVERNQNIFELMERLKENRRWWQDKYPCEAIYVKLYNHDDLSIEGKVTLSCRALPESKTGSSSSRHWECPTGVMAEASCLNYFKEHRRLVPLTASFRLHDFAHFLERKTADTSLHSLARRFLAYTTDAKLRHYDQLSDQRKAENEKRDKLISIADLLPAEYVPHTDPLKAKRGESYGWHLRFPNGLSKLVKACIVLTIALVIGITVAVLTKGLASQLTNFCLATAACLTVSVFVLDLVVSTIERWLGIDELKWI